MHNIRQYQAKEAKMVNTNKKYDYLIVGAGLYGAMFAHQAIASGKTCLVIDKNPFIGGFCHTKNEHGIVVHKFGAHIFHTSNKAAWDFVNSITPFKRFVNSPLAFTDDCRIFNLPFNMNTFYQLWGVKTPGEAVEKLSEQKNSAMKKLEAEGVTDPRNLEEQALCLVGEDMYKLLVKGYTEKQWRLPCSELPAFILNRIPVRLTYDNNYFDDQYQGVPECGYTSFIEKLIDRADVLLGVDFFSRDFSNVAKQIVYTGPIDRYFNYCYGHLDWRSVRFEEMYISDCTNFQGNAVVNYMSKDVPYTRTIEHKHFLSNPHPRGTVVSYEYPADTNEKCPPAYPIPTKKNLELYAKYLELAKDTPNVIFGGRLAEYKYYNMNDIIEKFIS